jgi:DNA-binding MarR family transcriptional regulator
MADINVLTLSSRPLESGSATAEHGQAQGPAFDLIELLFFAYRDFIGDADEVLARLDFGRAHHRVLHFVNRHPGIRVADLLDVLKITKQSLGRVLRELVDNGYVVQRAGPADRRQRLLFATQKGEALALELALLQTRRFARALHECGGEAREAARKFLAAMIEPSARADVEALIARADREAKNRPR